MSVYQSLYRDWQQLGASPSAARRMSTWAAAEPALAGYHTPSALVAAIGATPRGPLAHDLLRCLLRQAADPMAARTFLQAILPALSAAKVWSPDHSAERIAATWEAIRVHAGESPQYPARFIVRIAERRLRTVREADRRHCARFEEINCDLDVGGVELDDARTAADQVELRVLAAFRSGKLTALQARLLYATAVVGLRACDAGRAVGLPSRSVYRALDDAEATLIRVSA
jgi:hypothetical protein